MSSATRPSPARPPSQPVYRAGTGRLWSAGLSMPRPPSLLSDITSFPLLGAASFLQRADATLDFADTSIRFAALIDCHFHTARQHDHLLRQISQRTFDGLEPSKALLPKLALLFPKTVNLFADVPQDSHRKIGRFHAPD